MSSEAHAAARPRPGGSIATRLGVAIALVLVVGGMIVTFAALAYGRQAAAEAFDKLLAGAAFEIAGAISVADGGPTVDLPTSAFQILALAPDDRVFYRVLTADGATLTGYDDLAAPSTVGERVAFSSARFRGAPVRRAALKRVVVERSFVGEVIVVVAQTERARDALAWNIARPALWITFVAGLVLIALAAAAVRTSLRPLRRIEQALLARDPRDLTPLAVAAPREVGAMVGALDRFMARLARRVAAMQSLIADATHQLRTPVAALRAQAELARGETDPARLREIVERIHRRSLGLGRLTDQLLNQAMIIHRTDSAMRGRVDLRRVAIAVADEVDHDFPSTGDALRLDLPEAPTFVLGDAFSLTEATKNLVSNAFRYGAPPVTLTVEALADERVRIAAHDHGAGVPEADWADIGRRFARTSGAAPDSAGLGLAIVKAVADAHGGRLAFDRPAGGGFRAALTLPATATPDAARDPEAGRTEDLAGEFAEELAEEFAEEFAKDPADGPHARRTP